MPVATDTVMSQDISFPRDCMKRSFFSYTFQKYMYHFQTTPIIAAFDFKFCNTHVSGFEKTGIKFNFYGHNINMCFYTKKV